MPATAAKKSRVPELSLIIIGAGIIALLLFTGNMKRLIELIFNRTALVIAVVMLVEYVIIKGFDRSAQYRRQLESSQGKRREDLLTIQRVEQRLAELESELAKHAEDKGDAGGKAAGLRGQVAKIREEIKSRG